MNKIFFQMQFKSVEIKQDEWKIMIEWFASTPDIDRYDDIVLPKAFQKSIDEWWNYYNNPVILLWHRSEDVIWKAIEFKIKKWWLYLKAEILNNLKDVFKSIQDWLTKWFSIWFIPLSWEYQDEKWNTIESLSQRFEAIENNIRIIRVIKELDLIEVSVVNTPANPSALFTLSKAIKSFFDELEIKELNIKNEEIIEDIKTIDWDNEEQGEDIEKLGENPETLEKIEQDETPQETKNFQEIENLKKQIDEIKTYNQEIDWINKELIQTVEFLSEKILKVEKQFNQIPTSKRRLIISWNNEKDENLWNLLKQAKERAWIF